MLQRKAITNQFSAKLIRGNISGKSFLRKEITINLVRKTYNRTFRV